jgi:hypothetical protein
MGGAGEHRRTGGWVVKDGGWGMEGRSDPEKDDPGGGGQDRVAEGRPGGPPRADQRPREGR